MRHRSARQIRSRPSYAKTVSSARKVSHTGSYIKRRWVTGALGFENDFIAGVMLESQPDACSGHYIDLNSLAVRAASSCTAVQKGNFHAHALFRRYRIVRYRSLSEFVEKPNGSYPPKLHSESGAREPEKCPGPMWAARKRICKLTRP